MTRARNEDSLYIGLQWSSLPRGLPRTLKLRLLVWLVDIHVAKSILHVIASTALQVMLGPIVLKASAVTCTLVLGLERAHKRGVETCVLARPMR